MIVFNFITDIVAFIALLASIYAVWITTRFKKRQLSLIESQERLNKQTMVRGQREELDLQKANLGASFTKLTRPGRYKLRIYNQGKATARNVRIEFPTGNDVVNNEDIKQKFPMEVLEPYQSVDLNAFAGLDTRRKHTFQLRWVDDFSESNEKTVYPTL